MIWIPVRIQEFSFFISSLYIGVSTTLEIWEVYWNLKLLLEIWI